jgi:hypothetical protein
MEDPIERQAKFEERLERNLTNAQALVAERLLPCRLTTSHQDNPARGTDTSHVHFKPAFYHHSSLVNAKGGSGDGIEAGVVFCDEMLAEGRGPRPERPTSWFGSYK